MNDELEDLRDVSLADAIKEARRRIKVKTDKLRDELNVKFGERLAAIMTQSAPAADAASPPSKKTIAPTPDDPCDSPTRKLESVLVEERIVRRRLNDDAPEPDIGQLVSRQAVRRLAVFRQNACEGHRCVVAS